MDIMLSERYTVHAEAVAAYLEVHMDQTIKVADMLERRGYSYNNAVVLWQEAVARAFDVLSFTAGDLDEGPKEYRLYHKAWKFARSL